MPGPELPQPPLAGDETATLVGFLDLLRASLERKCSGLDVAGLAATLGPSSMTLGGLLKHLAYVEDTWFRVRFAGQSDDPLWGAVDWAADPDFDFRTATDVPGDELRRRYTEACARSRQVVARTDSLDQRSAQARANGQYFDLRWVLLHMIEETARHAGHADLLREAIDGTVGD